MRRASIRAARRDLRASGVESGWGGVGSLVVVVSFDVEALLEVSTFGEDDVLSAGGGTIDEMEEDPES